MGILKNNIYPKQVEQKFTSLVKMVTNAKQSPQLEGIKRDLRNALEDSSDDWAHDKFVNDLLLACLKYLNS